MSGNYTANTRLKLRKPAQPFWSCYWDNLVSLGTRARVSVDYFFKATITGADRRGFSSPADLNSAFGNTGQFEWQYIIVDPTDVTSPDPLVGCDAVWSITTAPTTAPGGKGNELIVTQLKRSSAKWDGGSRPQLNGIYNPSTSSARRKICIKQKFKTPSNFLSTFDGYPVGGDGFGWMELLAIKNGVGGLTDGRFNIFVGRNFLRGDTGMCFMCQFDSGSGGGTKYWRSDFTADGSCQPDTWYEYTYYVEQPATGGKDNLTDGICQCIIQNLSTGEFITVVNRKGGRFYGDSNYPITRLSPILVYTGGYPSAGTLTLKFSDLEFYDEPVYPLQKLDSMSFISDRHVKISPLTGIAHEINGVLGSASALNVLRQSFTDGGSLLAAASGTARPDTGYPVIESVTQSTFAVDATSHAVTMPATVNVGDGLIVILTTDGSPTITTPTGWKLLYSEANGSALTGAAYAKVARGTEGGTTVDFVTSVAESVAAQVYRISNWNGTLAGIQAGTVGEITTGTTADLPAVTAYWGSSKAIWLGTLHTSTSQTVSSAPTNYTNLTQTSTGTATTDSQCITARRSLEAASEDPGVFTMSGSGASKVYNTISIAPAYVGARYEHFDITSGGTTLWTGMYTSQLYASADANITRAIIVLHGNSLDAAEYFNVVRKNMESYLGKAIIIAPFFAESDSDPDTNQLFWGTSWEALGRSSATLAWRISSGTVLDTLIASLYSTFVNLEGVIICGHSAGGQMTNRYSAASSDTRNRYLVSAASSYLYPGNKRTNGSGGWSVPASPSTYNDYKYGLDNRSSIAYMDAIPTDTLRANLKNAKVTYMVGANDNNPADTTMDLSADAGVQGAHRVERQSLYIDQLMAYYP